VITSLLIYTRNLPGLTICLEQALASGSGFMKKDCADILKGSETACVFGTV
jgi:hypothetical protein